MLAQFRLAALRPTNALRTGALSAGVPNVSAGAQAREMATLRELSLRLKSVQNISKITKSMKMIASTKLSKAQRAMEVAREYGKASNRVFEASEATAPTEGKKLVICVSSDRGLCGGIHSSVSKATKKILNADPDSSVVILGDKAKGQIQRDSRTRIVLSFNQIGKNIPTYLEAAAIADSIRNNAGPFVSATIIYNAFKSVIAYEATPIVTYSQEAIQSAAKINDYELSDDAVPDLQTFSFANSLYWAMTEGHAAEMASKRTAMENATKNAGEMIESMTMQYNRSRQAVITNELIDIITGASAL